MCPKEISYSSLHPQRLTHNKYSKCIFTGCIKGKEVKEEILIMEETLKIKFWIHTVVKASG